MSIFHRNKTIREPIKKIRLVLGHHPKLQTPPTHPPKEFRRPHYDEDDGDEDDEEDDDDDDDDDEGETMTRSRHVHILI